MPKAPPSKPSTSTSAGRRQRYGKAPTSKLPKNTANASLESDESPNANDYTHELVSDKTLDKAFVLRLIIAKLEAGKNCDWYALSVNMNAQGGKGASAIGRTQDKSAKGKGKGAKGMGRVKKGKKGDNDDEDYEDLPDIGVAGEGRKVKEGYTGVELHDCFHNVILPALKAGRPLWVDDSAPVDLEWLNGGSHMPAPSPKHTTLAIQSLGQGVDAVPKIVPGNEVSSAIQPKADIGIEVDVESSDYEHDGTSAVYEIGALNPEEIDELDGSSDDSQLRSPLLKSNFLSRATVSTPSPSVARPAPGQGQGKLNFPVPYSRPTSKVAPAAVAAPRSTGSFRSAGSASPSGSALGSGYGSDGKRVMKYWKVRPGESVDVPHAENPVGAGLGARVVRKTT